ncbi:MAG: hypothetical protein NUV53_02670 [Patescibacteria group bacterium]|nr:hypothetical protein [Patescibacteria group bacterium]
MKKTYMRSLEEIILFISNNIHRIVALIECEDVHVYKFLTAEFKKGDVRNNFVFQFVFRSYYGLDRAGLSPEFKHEYFELMQYFRKKESFTDKDVAKILLELQSFEDVQGRNAVQFSFTTKLLNMINPEYPIYDSKISHIFGFGYPSKYKRIEKYLSYYTTLKDFYKQMRIDGRCKNMLLVFNKKFSDCPIPDSKKLDFILWVAGKLGIQPK